MFIWSVIERQFFYMQRYININISNSIILLQSKFNYYTIGLSLVDNVTSLIIIFPLRNIVFCINNLQNRPAHEK